MEWDVVTDGSVNASGVGVSLNGVAPVVVGRKWDGGIWIQGDGWLRDAKDSLFIVVDIGWFVGRYVGGRSGCDSGLGDDWCRGGVVGCGCCDLGLAEGVEKRCESMSAWGCA